MKIFNAILLIALSQTSAFMMPSSRQIAKTELKSATSSRSALEIAEGGMSGQYPMDFGGPEHVQRLLASSKPVKVQGGSLKTWSLMSAAVERVRIVLCTEGRPLDADIDLWHGPDNTPNKMRVYVEDGANRPFSAVVETPRGPNTVAVRNIGQLEFPLDAYVLPNPDDHAATVPDVEPPRTIQGGALRTYPFDSNVQSVQIRLTTDGRPLNARIELLQGPNNIKQVMELYLEDGMERPFFAVIESPGSGNVVRIVNTATVEFPMTATVIPFIVGDEDLASDVVLGGDGSEFGRRDLQW